MKALVHIPAELESRIQELISRGTCGSFGEFVLRALENQVVAESEDTNPWIVHSTTPVISSNQRELLKICEHPQTIGPPSDDKFANHVLWGQYYRYLPIKIGLRVLGNMSTDSFVTLDRFTKEAAEVALQFGYQMKRLDAKSVDKIELAVSFPTHEEKSVKRYVAQYLIGKRPTDGKLYGMMADLRFANISEQGGELKVGLTEDGKKFTLLPNPVIDGDGDEPLSDEEIRFILSYIRMVMPKEHSALLNMLHGIENGANTREALNETMKNFYQQDIPDAKKWSQEHVATMRGGLLSRLAEFGFIMKQKNGKNVTYLLSQKGLKYLERNIALLHHME